MGVPHVVIACRGCGEGGSVAAVANKQARELAKYFAVTLVSDSFPSELSASIRKGAVLARRFDYLRRFCHVPNEYFFVRTARYYLQSLYQTHRIDALICHGHALAALAARQLKHSYGVPYALVTHGDIFERPRGTYDSRLTTFYKMVTPLAYREADLVLALSPSMASRAISGGAAKTAVSIVPNGIDPEDIGLDGPVPSKPSAFQGNKSPIRLLFVGRLSVEKGVSVLIEACRLLADNQVKFQLDLIGTGKLEVDLRNLVLKLGLAERVVFLGAVERKSLGEYYRRADFVCVPSISDTLPGVVLEALVSGTPVIGSNVGGIPFMLQEGTNGVLVPPGSSEAIATAIQEVVNSPLKLQSLTDNASSSVFPKFSWEAIGEHMKTLILQIAEGSGYTTSSR